MTISFTPAPTLPSLNDPANFNAHSLALFSWLVGTHIAEQEGLSAEDFFQVMASLTDSTAGKLMPVGAFGLGAKSTSPPPGNDISDGIPSGFYTTDANTAGTGSETPVNGALLHVQRGEGTGNPGAFQLWQRGNGPLLYRRFASGVPTDWISFEPERDSNANGEYVKFPDGTLICTKVTSTTSDTVDSSWTFPAPFSTTAGLAVTAAPRSSANACFCSVRPPSVSSVSFNLWNTSAARLDGLGVSLMAIGRWK